VDFKEIPVIKARDIILKTLLMVALACSPLAGNNIPTGLGPIFKGIEPGKPFHPVWPPIVGQNLVGTIVIAKSPSKPEAYFGSIEAFRNSSYAGQFKTEQLGYDAPALTQSHNIDVMAAFTQLDAIASAAKAGAKATSLVGKAVEQNGTEKPASTTPAKTTSDPAALTASNPATTCGGDNGKTNNTPSGAPATDKQATAKTGKPASTTPSTKSTNKSASSGSSANSQASSNSTKMDFSKMSSAQVQICGLAVVYYTLDTLGDIAAKHALTEDGNDYLTASQKGWIVNRALVATSMEYTFNSSTALDAGFFAKLTAWLPGVSVKYKGANTVTIRTTSPLTIGYKLWRPGLDVTGAGASEAKIEDIGRDAADIDAILRGKLN
jgi:hypothetical protein